MRKGEPTANELALARSIRNAVEGNEWTELVEQKVIASHRMAIEVARRRDQSDKDLARKKKRGIR